MPIQIMSQQLASQIAAGEVVAGPLSIVKECVENAIDAQATLIDITLHQAGSSLILIRDNGVGMDKDDLSKCMLPHATSKISKLNDLQTIHTLGFRGEALASIASVAQLTITSCTKSMEHAWQTMQGEQVQKQGAWQLVPASHPVGSTIEVKELFYNTPARKKFMRSQKSELRHIVKLVETLALSQFDIGFTLMHEDKYKCQLPIADRWQEVEKRIAIVLGGEFLKHSMHIDQCSADMRLHGWIGLPQYTRASADQQYCFVNNRLVKDKVLIQAIRLAYQKVLFHGRHAAYVLYLEVPPHLIDVNVHPTKNEVRFCDSRSIFQFMQSTIHKALAAMPVFNQQLNDGVKEATVEAKEATTKSISSQINLQTNHPSAEQVQYASVATPVLVEAVSEVMVSEQTAAQLNGHASVPMDMFKSDRAQINALATEDASKGCQQAVHVELGTAIGQCHRRYILSQNNNGLIVIDQHAAHERILFEKLKVLSTSQTSVQQLLLPLKIQLQPFDLELCEQWIPKLMGLGFDIVLDEHCLSINAVPSLLAHVDIEAILMDVWSDMQANTMKDRLDYIMDRMLANMACKAAIKANHELSLVEMNALLRDMENTPFGGLCNHGRPAIRFFDAKELDSWFLRGQ